MTRGFSKQLSLLPILVASALLLLGCASSKINWEGRVGTYTCDQAVIELGPPDRSAKLSDGKTVSEWLLYRGRAGSSYHYAPSPGGFWSYSDPGFPDRFIRLTFSADGRLESWKKVLK